MKFEGSFPIAAHADHVYETFKSVQGLTHCIPGVENVKLIGTNQYEADMTVKIQFMTITFKVSGEVKPNDQEKLIEGTLSGKPNKLAGLFQNRVIIRVNECDEMQTKVDYQMEVKMMGRLASLGEILVRNTINQTAEKLIQNVQAYFHQESQVNS